MYVRLSYNTLVTPITAFELLWFIFNNSISSVSGLTSHASYLQASFLHAGNFTQFNPSLSQIIRTNNPTNVQMNRFQDTSGTVQHAITFRFQSYDAPTQKYFYQIYNSSNATNYTILCGESVSPVWPGTTISSGSGTTNRMTLSNNMIQVSSATQSYYDYHFHLTDKGIIWFTQGQFLNSLTGFPGTFSNIANNMGPYMCGQYTRYDLFNTVANNMIPVMATRITSSGNNVMGISGRHFNTYSNPNATSPEVGFSVLTALNMSMTTNTVAVARTINQGVHFGVGCRTSDAYAVALTAINNTTNSGVATYGKAITTTAYERFPLADNSGYGHAFLPIFWSLSSFMSAGGNVTDQTGIYIYNGDYYPGDEVTYNNKTYVIWPLWDGFSNRIGIAVPEE